MLVEASSPNGSTSLSPDILLVICACDSKRTGQRELGEVVTVEARNVLIIGAGEGLLGLHDLNAIGHTRGEAILRASKVLVR